MKAYCSKERQVDDVESRSCELNGIQAQLEVKLLKYFEVRFTQIFKVFDSDSVDGFQDLESLLKIKCCGLQLCQLKATHKLLRSVAGQNHRKQNLCA